MELEAQSQHLSVSSSKKRSDFKRAQSAGMVKAKSKVAMRSGTINIEGIGGGQSKGAVQPAMPACLQDQRNLEE